MEGEALSVELAQSFTDYLGHLLIDSNAFLIDLTHVMNNKIEALPSHVTGPLKNDLDRIENHSISNLF